MKYFHDQRTAGHLGVAKIFSKLCRSDFYWPSMRQTSRRWVQNCQMCQKRKQPSRTKPAEMVHYQVGAPLERIAVDILGPLPVSDRRNKFIMVVGDYFTRWTECYPIPNPQAPTVATKLVEEFVARFGVPLELHSDQGRDFESAVFGEMCSLLGVTKTRTTPYHPRSDGMIERFNRTIENMLSLWVSKSQTDWDQHLALLTMAYRSSEHASTGETPNAMMLGREVTMPIDLLVGSRTQDEPEPTTVYAQRLQDKLHIAHEVVRETLGKCMRSQKKQYDRNVKKVMYSEGAVVWLHKKHREKGRSPKLTLHWTGPYVIVNKISDVVYRIQRSPRATPLVVHADRLKPCHGVTKEDCGFRRRLATDRHTGSPGKSSPPDTTPEQTTSPGQPSPPGQPTPLGRPHPRTRPTSPAQYSPPSPPPVQSPPSVQPGASGQSPPPGQPTLPGQPSSPGQSTPPVQRTSVGQSRPPKPQTPQFPRDGGFVLTDVQQRTRRGRPVRKPSRYLQKISRLSTIEGDKHTNMSKPEGSAGIYLCQTCGKSYASAYGRRRHQRAAHEGRQYGCRVCGSLFRRPEYVARHMKVHGQEAVATPGACGGSYAEPSLPTPTRSANQDQTGNTRRAGGARLTSGADQDSEAISWSSPVRRIVSEEAIDTEGAFLFVHGQWYTARTIQSVGLTLSDPPPGTLPQTCDVAVQTEAVLMREEFTTHMTETVDDAFAGTLTVRETESRGVREPGDIFWRTWHRGTLP